MYNSYHLGAWGQALDPLSTTISGNFLRYIYE